MKPPPFEYRRASTIDEALAYLDADGDEAKVIAGGQSLVPMMNLRLASPAVLVDINQLPLEAVLTDRDVVQLGALVRQRRLLTHDRLRDAVPLLAEAARHVAHPAVRNRGTVGGSLSHADPTAELATVALALDARVTVRSSSGRRALAVDDFLVGPFMTDLEPNELVTAVTFPRQAPDRRSAFVELAERGGDFAVAAAAVSFTIRDRVISDARVVLAGAGGRPVRAPASEVALEGASLTPRTLEDAANAAVTDLEVHPDAHASAAFKSHLLSTLAGRALSRAAGAKEGA